MVVAKHFDLEAWVECFDAEVVRHQPKCVEGIQNENDLQRLSPASFKLENRGDNSRKTDRKRHEPENVD